MHVFVFLLQQEQVLVIIISKLFIRLLCFFSILLYRIRKYKYKVRCKHLKSKVQLVNLRCLKCLVTLDTVSCSQAMSAIWKCEEACGVWDLTALY